MSALVLSIMALISACSGWGTANLSSVCWRSSRKASHSAAAIIRSLCESFMERPVYLCGPPAASAEHFRNEVFEACRGNAMMGLVYPWVRVQAGIDHDPVNKVIDHGGDAIDTAKSLVKAGRILGRHWSLLLFLKAG